MKKLETKFGYVNYQKDDCEDNAVELQLITTYPEYRGQGKGAELLRQFEELAEKEGYDKITMAVADEDSYSDYQYLLDFYTGNGYDIEEDTGTMAILYKNL